MAKTDMARRSQTAFYLKFERFLVPGLALALLCAASCGGSRAPKPPPVSRIIATPALLADLAPQFPIWLYVPLAGRQRAEVTGQELARATQLCLRNADATEGRGADSLVFCLNQRGFYPALCSDGSDNDGDGLTDFPNDPGCAAPEALREDPVCDDGRDNDGDGLIDFDGGGRAHPDPGCESPSDPIEFDEERRIGR